MIRRITCGGFIAWPHDLFHGYGDYGRQIDQQSESLAKHIVENSRLRDENRQLQMQLADTKNELEKTETSYRFYFNAYQELQREQNTKRR